MIQNHITSPLASLVPLVTTWANRPALANYPAWRKIVFSDVGASFSTANRGSEWFHDGTVWRPWGGSQIIYTMGSSVADKTTNLTTPETLASVRIPAGLLANSDFRLFMVASYNKSASTDAMANAYYLGATNTAAGDTQIVANAQNTTSRQGQTQRFFSRASATSVIVPYTGNSAFGTTTLTPPAAVTVPDLDANDTWLGAALFLSTGITETMQLTQFDVWIEG